MTTLTTECAVTRTSDGKQQIFPFETDDGVIIPHECPSEVVVSVNGRDLAASEYSISYDKGRSVVTLHAAPMLGAEVELSRHTHLIQPKKFRRSGDWDISVVEESLDRLTRAVIDALWRISKIEKVVQVEHRVVEVPAHVSAPAIDDVQGLADELRKIRESSAQHPPGNLETIAETIADIVLLEVKKHRTETSKNDEVLASRVARLEENLTALYHEVGRT